MVQMIYVSKIALNWKVDSAVVVMMVIGLRVITYPAKVKHMQCNVYSIS